MKLVCWNVNGWNPTCEKVKDRFTSVRGFLDHIVKDVSTMTRQDDGKDGVVLCLQEVKLTEDKLTKENCVLDDEGFESYWACCRKRKGYSGVATILDSPVFRPHRVVLDTLSDTVDGEGRFVSVDIGPCVVINVYVPNSGLGKKSKSNVGDGSEQSAEGERVMYKLEFLKQLLEHCRRLVEEEKKEIILVGDFNACFDAKDVHPGIGLEKAFLECEIEALHAFTKNGLFTDMFRSRHPMADRSYTCFDERTNARAGNRGVRIDFVLVTAGLLPLVKQCSIVPGTTIPAKWSDHCALFLDIDIVPDRGERKPLQEWRALRKKLLNTSQKTILGMFGKRASVTKNDVNDGASKKAKP